MTAVYRSDNFHRANGIPTRIPSVVRFPMHKHSTRFSPVNLLRSMIWRSGASRPRHNENPQNRLLMAAYLFNMRPRSQISRWREPEFKLGRIYLTIKIRTIPKP
jgi:hypothetical protein